MIEFLLASKSPRRKQLLGALSWPVTVVNIDVDESIFSPVPTAAVAEILAIRKASAYPNKNILQHQVLLTADTVVIHRDKVLGKPHSKEDAIAMLKELSGDVHYVHTGVCLKTRYQSKSFTEKTAVHFKMLTDEEINFYVDNFNPMDKAGSYGIQEWIGMIGVERIEGCYYNVMGLPISRVYSEVKNLMSV